MISMIKHEIAAIIPALNESASIKKVIDNCSKYAFVLIVDDGSTDQTRTIALEQGAQVLSHDITRGYEAALESGFARASEMGFKYVITLDADGQHSAELIPKFHKKLLMGYDIVVGSRDRLQRVGEYIFSYFGQFLWGIHDPLCGMKAYNIECVSGDVGINKYDSVGTKFTINAVKLGKRIISIKIPTQPRIDGARFGVGWKANKKILYALYMAILK